MTMAPTSMTATEAEIAAAAQEAADAIQRQEVKDGERVGGEMPELRGAVKPLQYKISAADQGSWVMVWELKLDTDGSVYGDPTRAPRQQLGLWLQKKRDDGGPRFSVEMPKRLRAEATIPCLYNGPERCTKRFYTRQDMVEHVDGTHPRFARINQVILQKIMDAVAEDNPNLAKMAEAIANMGDRGMVSVEVDPSPRKDKVDSTLGTPTVTTMGIAPAQPVQEADNGGCGFCDWMPKDDTIDKARARYMHLIVKHKDEV